MGGIEKGEFFRFDKEKEKWKKHEGILHKQFYFSRHDFFLVEEKGYYFVCVVSKGYLISLWYEKIVENRVKKLPGESISDFRKKWMQNNVDEDRLSMFIENPIEHEKKFKIRTK